MLLNYLEAENIVASFRSAAVLAESALSAVCALLAGREASELAVI